MEEFLSIQEINEKEFESFYKEGLVFINYFSEGCISSLIMEPIIEELFSEFNNQIRFAKMDVENNREIIRKLEIQKTPSFILFKDGRLLDKFSGERTFEEIEDKIRKILINF